MSLPEDFDLDRPVMLMIDELVATGEYTFDSAAQALDEAWSNRKQP